QAPWERWKWSTKRQLWALVLVLFPLSGCIIGLIIDPRGNWGFGLGMIGGITVGVLGAIALAVWGLGTTVSIKLLEPEVVQLKFPDSMSAVHDAYAAAYETFKTEHRGRRRPGASGDDEEWADDAAGSWDQGSPKK
ncbi:MAG TPA: hypothetical protein VL860_00380, partial [Planctomycetota bacterium]|nr:hypothetical protein [Planctomycetota bacterium]